jgi:hypothetical protein
MPMAVNGMPNVLIDRIARGLSGTVNWGTPVLVLVILRAETRVPRQNVM